MILNVLFAEHVLLVLKFLQPCCNFRFWHWMPDYISKPWFLWFLLFSCQ